ncbi:MAG: hypothetical protein CTY37_07135 [Methylotenera sp.]|nr:MAG: hypothetical protein CTY37_07135 [Methylotenera sp.]PPD17735.1 MAG: hypothetical protein CTY27_03255 [Methylotenera sp.]
MDSEKLDYVKSDVYLVHAKYIATTPVKPQQSVITGVVDLSADGVLTIHPRFDFSANFPAINTWDAIRGACEHDAFYWLMKNGYLSYEFRRLIDYFFYWRLVKDGMPKFRARYWWHAVRLGGESALRSAPPEVRYAPQPPKLIERSVHFPYLPVV